MADDIVTRLRNWHTEWNWYLPDEAADEIERLRADRDRWRDISDRLNEVCKRIIPYALLESDRHAIADYERAVRGD